MFEGKDEECFVDFKVKLERAFELNQTAETAKATKIRELLRGNAKNLVPDSVENIDDIYKVLDRAFGDPIRLLDYKKQSLSKIGAFPSYDIKGGHKVIVDWYLKLEIQLQDLLDLA